MIVKTELADGTFEIFETQNYKISRARDFHPMILKVDVYTGNGFRVKSVKRFFKFFYRHFTFKSEKVQKVIKELNEQNNATEQASEQ